jgi:hypothetical protein
MQVISGLPKQKSVSYGGVLDLYDRKVIGWAFSADMETVHTTIPAVEMAFLIVYLMGYSPK